MNQPRGDGCLLTIIGLLAYLLIVGFVMSGGGGGCVMSAGAAGAAASSQNPVQYCGR